MRNHPIIGHETDALFNGHRSSSRETFNEDGQ
jgi:hypothetical protein